MLGKEGIWPSMMILATPAPATSTPASKNAAQAHANPGIQTDKRRSVAMLKIAKPTLHGPIDVRDNDRQATSAISCSLATNRGPELLLTLSARPTRAALEVITQKIKASRLRRIHDSSLFRVQFESGFHRPLSNLL